MNAGGIRAIEWAKTRKRIQKKSRPGRTQVVLQPRAMEGASLHATGVKAPKKKGLIFLFHLILILRYVKDLSASLLVGQVIFVALLEN